MTWRPNYQRNPDIVNETKQKPFERCEYCGFCDKKQQLCYLNPTPERIIEDHWCSHFIPRMINEG